MVNHPQPLLSRRRASGVGAAGFEPTTYCSQSSRATGLRYAPNLDVNHVNLVGVYPAEWRDYPSNVPNIPPGSSSDSATRYLRGVIMPPPEQLASDQRTLRIIWLAVSMGVILLSAVMIFVVRTGSGGTITNGNLVFGLNAAINIAALIAGFSLQKKLDAELPLMGSYAEAMGRIRIRCILSIALVEGSALFAAIATFLTGDLLNLAFVVPFFAFAWLFFPSDARIAYWLSGGGSDR